MSRNIQFQFTAFLATMFIAACGNSEATPAPPTVQQQISKPASARKALKGEDQRWKGTGALFTTEGKQLAEYKLEMVRKRLSGSTYSNAVTIHLPDGKVNKMRCKMEMSGKRWTSNCGDSEGGGYCLGDGLCLDYIVDAAAHAFATTIIDDGDGQLRMLRTELDTGKAVRFFREKLALVR